MTHLQLEEWFDAKDGVSDRTAVPAILYFIFDQLRKMNDSITKLNSEIVDLNENLNQDE